MKSTFTAVLLTASLAVSVAAFGADAPPQPAKESKTVEAAFEPIPPSARDLYRFQLSRRFCADDAAFKAEGVKIIEAVKKLEGFKGKVLAGPKELLATLEARREMGDLMDKMDAYVYFKKAINTDDHLAREAQDKIDAEAGARTSFLKVELKALTSDKLKEMLGVEPGLNKYKYFLDNIVRNAPHTLSEEKESILSTLTPDLTAWQGDLFQKVFDRNTFPAIKVADKEFDVHRDFEGLMRSTDRSAREKAFKDYYEFFKKNSDLLAFGLRQEMKTLNSMAKLRGFETYFHEALFEMYTSREQVDKLYAQIEAAMPLYHAFQKFRGEVQKADLGIPAADIWDIEVPPKDAITLRFTAASATAMIMEALKPLGATYTHELGLLLDPKNGRLDIVGGPKREQGAFCIGYFGYFVDNFQGFLNDVSTMAHESGHAMMSQLVTNTKGSLLFEQGPSFMTESYAMFNEQLIRDYLLKTQTDPAVIAGIRWDVVNEAMYLWELARRAKFEMISYDRVAKDEIVDEKGFNKACVDTGKDYDLYFATHPELENHWMRKHHYWTSPTYYINYVYAQMLALKYYSMFLADPVGFPPKYVAMVTAGFDRPAGALLKDFLGIDLEDSSLLKSVVDMIQKQFDALKAAKSATLGK
ncbi:MAG: M3 family oligoendopeptidase [Candidatus Riflebacteria bacterium]|nr:M3 family oligoendopeptidase [Candidatus Riflebacteria bacterium]